MTMQHSVSGSGLADVLERILDKGIVVAGDVAVSLVGVELLTIRIRLVICSVDRALELGIRWWETDPALSADAARLRAENAALTDRLSRLEQALSLAPMPSAAGA
jgi:hypothetical protein